MKYGTVPVVRKTGGLADTVIDRNIHNSGTGFTFTDYSAKALLDVVKKTIDAYAEKESWQKIQVNGMAENFSWENSAKKYINLYELAIQKRKNSSV